MGWTEVLALISFGIAGSASPGPNNTLLLASGVRFGFRRTVPHIAGAAFGIGTLIMAVGAGVGTLLDASPAAHTGLKLVGSIYLLYLALRLGASRKIDSTSAAKPLSAWQAAIFQFVNPKAWILAIAVVAAFVPPALPSVLGAFLAASILTFVVTGSFTAWALGGAALGKVVASERIAHLLNLILSILLVASVGLLWI